MNADMQQLTENSFGHFSMTRFFPQHFQVFQLFQTSGHPGIRHREPTCQKGEEEGKSTGNSRRWNRFNKVNYGTSALEVVFETSNIACWSRRRASVTFCSCFWTSSSDISTGCMHKHTLLSHKSTGGRESCDWKGSNPSPKWIFGIFFDLCVCKIYCPSSASILTKS